jgi:hypothetical protein
MILNYEDRRTISDWAASATKAKALMAQGFV